MDVFLAEKTGETRSSVQTLIRSKSVILNDKEAYKTGIKLAKGDKVEILVASPSLKKNEKKKEEAEILEPKIICETDDYLVIDKPAGLLVHAGEKENEYSLADWIKKERPKMIGVGENEHRPGIVHRLDKDTSGVMVLAKNQKFFSRLKEQFKNREIEKEYLALVHGKIKADEGVIDFNLGRGAGGKMAARPKLDMTKLKNVERFLEGKKAITKFEVKKRFANSTLVAAFPRTGRTHQIRAHFFAYNHPLFGDKIYFNPRLSTRLARMPERLFLHSARLCFFDALGERKCFVSNPPIEFEKYLSLLK